MRIAPLEKINGLFIWVNRLFILNICWIIGIICGLGVLGIFPASTAALSIAREWLNDGEVKVRKEFISRYKKDFVSANKLGFIWMTGLMLVFLNYVALTKGFSTNAVVVFSYYLVIVIYASLSVHLFLLHTYFQTGTVQYFKNALIIGITKMPVTILLIGIHSVLLYAALLLPAFFLFFYGSLAAFLTVAVTNKMYQRLGEKRDIQQESIHYKTIEE